MLLLNSSAHHIYWLGRYLMRIHSVGTHLPFTDDLQATQFAMAFGLAIEDAELLNQYMLDIEQPFSLPNQFVIARDNIQELRGVLTSKAYAELNHLIKDVDAQPDALCRVVTECTELLKAEQQDVFLFFSLGQNVELLDIQLRFQQDLTSVLSALELLIQQLYTFGWEAIEPYWQALKQHPSWDTYYAFTQQLQYMFEVSL